MFTVSNNLRIINIKKMDVPKQFSVQKSVHSRYTGSGIFNQPQNKKASIHCELKLFEWGLKESNLRPSACKADALNQLS